MLGPLIGVVVLPLSEHAAYIVSSIDVGLIPIRAGWPSEHLMRINVPILHALHPIDAAVVGSEGFVDVTAFVVIVVHVRVKFTQSVSGWAGQEAFHDIAAHVVKIVAVVIEDGAAIIGVHDLASGFCAPVLVEQGAEGGRPGNRDDGFEVLTALSRRLPRCCSLVGFAVNRHVAVAPVLCPQPLNGSMDALSLAVTTVVETTGAFLGGEHGHLSQSIAVRNEVVVDEFPAPCADHVRWRGLASRRAVVKIGTDDGNHGDLFARFGVGGKPIGEVDFG